MVAQRTLNPWAVGSSPTRPITLLRGVYMVDQMELVKACRGKVFSAFEYYLRTEHNVRNILVHDDSAFNVEYPSWDSKVFDINMFRSRFDLHSDVCDHEYITNNICVDSFEMLSRHIVDNVENPYNKVFFSIEQMPIHSDYKGAGTVNTRLKISISK